MIQNKRIKKINKNSIKLIIIIAATVFGAILHIIPYFYNRSLWIDEAMLANSILTRSFADLVKEPLMNGQSAPVGYLYLQKIITSIFGTAEKCNKRNNSQLPFARAEN